MPLPDDATHRRALALARWAPSPHNTQPWRVTGSGDQLVLWPDPARALPRTDPTGRDLHLSLGAFQEALVLALAGEGHHYEPTEAPPGAFGALRHRGEARGDSRGESQGDSQAPSLLSLLRRRQTSRLPYSPREPEPAALKALEEVSRSQALRLHLVTRTSPEHQRLAGWLYAAQREVWLDGRTREELRRWIHLDPEGARTPAEGLSTHCLGLSAPEGLGLKALLAAPWAAADRIFAAPLAASALARHEVERASLAPLWGLLVAEREAAQAGAGLLRVWLEATRLGLVLQPFSALLNRRGWPLARHLGCAPGQLVLAFRLGHSVPPPRSARRELSLEDQAGMSS